jgi:hypothetical protein
MDIPQNDLDDMRFPEKIALLGLHGRAPIPHYPENKERPDTKLHHIFNDRVEET